MRIERWFKQLKPSYTDQIKTDVIFHDYFAEGYTLFECLSEPDVLQKIYQQLTVSEKRALYFIVYHWGVQYFTDLQYQSMLEQQKQDVSLYIGLLMLRRKGLIMTFRKAWGERVYLIPEEAFSIWQQMCIGPFDFNKDKQKTAEAESLKTVRIMSRSMNRAMLEWLAVLRMQGLRITKKGSFQKKDLRPFLERFNHEINDFKFPVPLSDRWGIPSYLAILLEMAQRLELIIQHDDRFLLHTDQLEAWLVKSPQDRDKELYHVWKDYSFQLVNEVMLIHLISLVESVPKEQWYCIQSAVDWVEQNMDGLTKELKQKLLRQWVEPLVILGWLELAEDKAGEIWIKWLESSSGDEEGIFIQPDLEIIVPPQVSFSLLWKLEAIADHLQTDQMSKYILTSSSVKRGMELGISYSTIRSELTQAAKSGVPETVESMLKQCAEQKQLVFSEAMLLYCEDPQTIKWIKEQPEAHSFVIDQAGEHYLIMNKSELSLCKKWLELMDLYVQNNKLVLSELNHEMGDQAKHSYDIMFQVDNTFPRLTEGFSKLEETPQMWLNHFRGYHASTYQSMIEQAIRWKSKIKILVQGEEKILLPKKIKEDASSLIVQGIQENNPMNNTYRLHDFEKMQIILPEEVLFSMGENML